MFFERFASSPLEVNTYILSGDNRGAVVIDPANAPKILSILRENQLALTHILLTHGHFDHISAVKQLKDATGAAIMIHEADSGALTTPNSNLSAMMGVDSVQAPADAFLKEGALSAGGLDFTVLHTPGHSPGCVCLLTEGMLFSGDTLFYRDIGRCDFPNSDFAAMRKSIDRLFALPDDTKVYPGHMRETAIGDEKRAGVVMGYFA